MMRFIEEDLPFIIIVAGLLGLFVLKVWLPHQKMDAMLRERVSEREAVLDKNYERYRELRRQIEAIEKNPAYVEKVAVSRYGFVKRGTLFKNTPPE